MKIPFSAQNRGVKQKIANLERRLSWSVQLRRTKQEIANSEENLTFELSKAVQELPPIYTRMLASGISCLLFGVLVWAYFCKVDEVAVGSGQLIPAVEVRPVRSVIAGNVRSVKVKEGDRVQQGDVLVELDRAVSQAEVDRLDKSAELIRQDIARLEAERSGRTNAGTPLQNQLLEARLQQFDSELAAAQADANKQVATIAEDQVRVTRLQENLADYKASLANAQTLLENEKGGLNIAQQRERSLHILVNPDNGAIPRIDYLDAKDKLVQAQVSITKSEGDIITTQDKITSTEKDIAAQGQEILQTQQAYQSAQKRADSLKSKRQSEILTELNKRGEELTTTVGEFEKAKTERDQETIKAPVSGTIYSLKVTTGGGTVQTSEELLSILPKGEELVLEVKVLNRDIGFVYKGMNAKVKIATFPYQEFGTVDGTVVEVSPNAINDKDLGLVFPTRIKLNKHSIMVRDRRVELEPGMAATGEVILRKKSILSFLLEPITRKFSEAFSVR